MKKIGMIVLVLIMVVVAYMFLTLIQPTIVAINTSVNTTLAASSNMSNYPGAADVVIGWPLWAYFIPAILGGVAVVGILRS